MHKCVFNLFLVLASSEFGVPVEHHLGNLCVVALSQKLSPYFDEYKRRLGSRHACKLPLNRIGTGDA